MTLDPIALFGPSAVALAVLLIMVSQAIKQEFSLTGWRAKLPPIALGLLLGFFGLRKTAANLLPDAGPILGSLILGLLMGLLAVGGYSLITWLQDRQIQKRAELPPTPVEVTVTPATPDAAPTLDAPGGFPADDPRSSIQPLLSLPSDDYAALRNG